MLKLSIDLNLIDKNRIKEVNGKKYYNLVAFPNRNGRNKYGNTHIIKDDLSKEDKEADTRANVERPILGNLDASQEMSFESVPNTTPFAAPYTGTSDAVAAKPASNVVNASDDFDPPF